MFEDSKESLSSEGIKYMKRINTQREVIEKLTKEIKMKESLIEALKQRLKGHEPQVVELLNEGGFVGD